MIISANFQFIPSHQCYESLLLLFSTLIVSLMCRHCSIDIILDTVLIRLKYLSASRFGLGNILFDHRGDILQRHSNVVQCLSQVSNRQCLDMCVYALLISDSSGYTTAQWSSVSLYNTIKLMIYEVISQQTNKHIYIFIYIICFNLSHYTRCLS